MKILILEDDGYRTKRMKSYLQERLSDLQATFVTTALEAIDELATKDWSLVSLDHDLGGLELVESGPGTGYEVACWLEQHPERKPPIIWVHSLNIVGRQRMLAALPDAIEMPGWWNDKDA